MAKGDGSDLTKDLLEACERLEERYGRRKPQKYGDFIEALVSQILELGVKEPTARAALERLRAEYVDWNDMRLATVREIEDILGPRYFRCREKAEDVKHLLADLYTAFRRMEIQDLLNADGIATLRALPDTTNIRRDMVDRALLLVLDLKVFPCDEDQFKLLKFLGGVPKPWAYQMGGKKIEDALDTEQMLRLSRVLREHVHTYQSAGESEPQGLDYGLKTDRPDKATTRKEAKESTARKDKPAKADKPTAKTEKAEKAEKAKPDGEDEEGLEPDDAPRQRREAAVVKDKTTKRASPPPAAKSDKHDKAEKAEKGTKAEKADKHEKTPAKKK
jgi:endonuclease III